MLTDSYHEDEIQALITLAELEDPIESPNNNSYKPFPRSRAEAQTYFRRFRVDLSSTFSSLHSRGFVDRKQEAWELTSIGKEVANQIRKARPPIYYWYKASLCFTPFDFTLTAGGAICILPPLLEYCTIHIKSCRLC